MLPIGPSDLLMQAKTRWKVLRRRKDGVLAHFVVSDGGCQFAPPRDTPFDAVTRTARAKRRQFLEMIRTVQKVTALISAEV